MSLRDLAFNISFNSSGSSEINDMNSAADELIGLVQSATDGMDDLSNAVEGIDSSPVDDLESATDHLADSTESATQRVGLMGRALDRVSNSRVGQSVSSGMDRVRGAVGGVTDRLGFLRTGLERLGNTRVGQTISRGMDTARSGVERLRNTASNVGQHLSNSMNSYGSSIRNAAGELDDLNKKMGSLGKSMMTKVTAPIVAGIGASINEFAKLEQSIGGVETLFKGSASVVIANSETAYKRAGISANGYMENITSFSASLLQGLGGDTEKAARVADMAMVDMSDNANKFGTDIGSVQNAYQGFAKDNFTMLDNLKLGYGGTASEMARLINDSGVMGGAFTATAESMKDVPFDKTIEAIHKIQDGMGVTGTTSKEAMETVAGSIGMAKSSLQDFLGGLGNSDADVGQLTKNMVESFSAVVENIKGVLATMWDNIPIAGWVKHLIVFATAIGPLLFGFSKLSGFLLKIPGMLSTMGSVFTIITGPIGITVALIAGVIAILVHLYRTNETVRDVILGVWESIKSAVSTAIGFIQGLWETHGESIKMTVMALFEVIKGVIMIAMAIIVGIITIVLGTIKVLWAVFGDTIMSLVSVAWGVIQSVISGAMQIVQGVIEVGTSIMSGSWSGALEGMKTIASGVWEAIKGVFKGGINGVTSLINGFIGGANKIKIPGIGGVNIPLIPQLAKGTPNWGGGIVQVHEQGGEIIDLPSGSRVFPHDKSVSMAREQGRSETPTTVVGAKQQSSKGNAISFSPTYHIAISGKATESDKKEIEKVIDKKTRELFNIFFKEMNMKMS